MKLCKKDVEDLMQVVYWASAIRTDAEALASGKALGSPVDYHSNIVRCVNELDACASRVLLGENRKPSQDKRTMQDDALSNHPASQPTVITTQNSLIRTIGQ